MQNPTPAGDFPPLSYRWNYTYLQRTGSGETTTAASILLHSQPRCTYKICRTTPESSVPAEAADKATENAKSKVCQEPSHNTFDSLAF